MHRDGFVYMGPALVGLTLVVLKLEYSGRARSTPWLLMTWCLASPGHQQPWYWLCRINKSLPSMMKNFYYILIELRLSCTNPLICHQLKNDIKRQTYYHVTRNQFLLLQVWKVARLLPNWPGNGRTTWRACRRTSAATCTLRTTSGDVLSQLCPAPRTQRAMRATDPSCLTSISFHTTISQPWMWVPRSYNHSLGTCAENMVSVLEKTFWRSFFVKYFLNCFCIPRWLWGLFDDWFFITMRIWLKFLLALIHILINWSLQNFVWIYNGLSPV